MFHKVELIVEELKLELHNFTAEEKGEEPYEFYISLLLAREKGATEHHTLK